MTRAEINRERARVLRALAWGCNRVRRQFAFVVEPMDEMTLKKNRGAALVPSRSNRGGADPHLFEIRFNPAETVPMNRKDLRRLATHEVLHCAGWDLFEAADDINREEEYVYTLQRALVGEVGEP